MAARRDDVTRMIREKYRRLSPLLDEKTRRLFCAAEAMALGRGGPVWVSEATGMSRGTIDIGIKELKNPHSVLPAGRSRRKGAGRKPAIEKDPTLLADLDRLVEPSTRGDPQSPLRWTSKSTAKLAQELKALGHEVSDRTVAHLLDDLGYSRQANAKTREGADHPDRDAQFEYINAQAKAFQRRGQPVISVDAKKNELLGDYKNAGREWQPKGQPEKVNTHDFPDPDVPKAFPYGVYDLTRNEGWVSVGVDHNTAEFAVQTIRSWFRQMGREAYPEATELLITADAGSNNGYRLHQWKVGLQQLADEENLQITVCHFPPGTSKWNKIEHRMFSEISKNWRGRPLTSYEVIVNLIGNTRTKTGLRIKAKLDPRQYEIGVKVNKEELSSVQLRRANFHGEWNYTVLPRSRTG